MQHLPVGKIWFDIDELPTLLVDRRYLTTFKRYQAVRTLRSTIYGEQTEGDMSSRPTDVRCGP